MFRTQYVVSEVAQILFSEPLHRPTGKRPAVTDPPGIGCHIDQGSGISDRSGMAVGFDRRPRRTRIQNFETSPVSFLGIERNLLAFDKIAAAMRALKFLKATPYPCEFTPQLLNRLAACKSKQFLVRSPPCDIRPDYRQNLKCNLCRRFMFGCDGQFSANGGLNANTSSLSTSCQTGRITLRPAILDATSPCNSRFDQGLLMKSGLVTRCRSASWRGHDQSTRTEGVA